MVSQFKSVPISCKDSRAEIKEVAISDLWCFPETKWRKSQHGLRHFVLKSLSRHDQVPMSFSISSKDGQSAVSNLEELLCFQSLRQCLFAMKAAKIWIQNEIPVLTNGTAGRKNGNSVEFWTFCSREARHLRPRLPFHGLNAISAENEIQIC